MGRFTITLHKKDSKQQEEPQRMLMFKRIESGHVFEYYDGVLALKITANKAVLLTHRDRSPWFSLAQGFEDHFHHIVADHGMLIEMITST